VRQIKVALGHAQIHAPALVERIAGHLTRHLEFAFCSSSGAELASLKSSENFSLFCAYFVLHDNRLLW